MTARATTVSKETIMETCGENDEKCRIDDDAYFMQLIVFFKIIFLVFCDTNGNEHVHAV